MPRRSIPDRFPRKKFFLYTRCFIRRGQWIVAAKGAGFWLAARRIRYLMIWFSKNRRHAGLSGNHAGVLQGRSAKFCKEYPLFAETSNNDGNRRARRRQIIMRHVERRLVYTNRFRRSARFPSWEWRNRSDAGGFGHRLCGLITQAGGFENTSTRCRRAQR